MYRRRRRTGAQPQHSVFQAAVLAGHMIWIGGNIALFVVGTVKRPPGGPVMVNQAYALGWQLVTADHFTPGPVVELLALLLVLASLRWLVIGFRVLFGAGPIEVRPIDDGSTVPEAELHHLNVSFREYLTLPRLYKVTTIPGDPEPDRLIEILRTPPSSGLLGFMAAAYAYALPRRAFIISATLRTRDHHQHRYGVSVQVRKLPGYAIELESQWSGSFERALQRAAYAVGAYILPSTRRCKNVPWSEWRGRALPVSLFRDYQRAKKMVGERRFDEAMALYHRALLQDADNIGLRYDLGQLYERLKLYPDALYIYLRLVNEIFPARPQRRGDPRRTARPQWWPERARDPFVIRYRYVVTLGLGSAMASELSAPDWPQLQPWINLAGPNGPGDGDREDRPWRASELADIRRLLSTALDRLFPSLADEHAPDGTLLAKLRPDQAEGADGRQGPPASARVEQYLLECAIREVDALAEDFRAMRARAWWRPHAWWRQSGASSLTLTAILQTTVILRYRLDRLASRSPARPGASPWPHDLAGIKSDLKDSHYEPADSRKWLEHYNAACAYALALIDDDQDVAEHRNHAYAAVESLERALGCGEDDDFPRAKQYWLQAGDPDFAGLRRYECFRAFEARVYGRPLPAADDVARYELRRERREDDDSPDLPKDRSSWWTTVLGLFAVTMILAALTVFGSTRASTPGNVSPTDIFTDLSGVGALLGGVAAMLVFVVGYRDRRKKQKAEARAEVLTKVIDRATNMGPDEIRAIADLAEVLNGDRGTDEGLRIKMSVPVPWPTHRTNNPAVATLGEPAAIDPPSDDG